VPLHEFECRACGSSFELLLRGATPPICPSCASADLDRLISGFAVSSEGTRGSALQAARRKSLQNRDRRDKQRADAEDTLEHLRDDYGIDAAKPKTGSH
jgi:putative FmdB family regulatory protein